MKLWMFFLGIAGVAVVGFMIAIYFAVNYYKELNELKRYPLGMSFTPDKLDLDYATLVLLGDSRAAAWNVPESGMFHKVINLGVDGFTSSQMKYKLQTEIHAFNNATLLIQVGINDLKTIALFPEQKELIIAQTEDNIRESIMVCKKKGAGRIILSTVFPIGKLPLYRRPFWSVDVNLSVEDLNRRIYLLQKTAGVVVWDTYHLLEDPQKRNAWGKAGFYADFLHLNLKGYDILNTDFLKLVKSFD